MDVDLCLCISQGLHLSENADWDRPGEETQEQTGIREDRWGGGRAHVEPRRNSGRWMLGVKKFQEDLSQLTWLLFSRCVYATH